MRVMHGALCAKKEGAGKAGAGGGAKSPKEPQARSFAREEFVRDVFGSGASWAKGSRPSHLLSGKSVVSKKGFNVGRIYIIIIVVLA